jgi:hypothetical protein
MPRGSDGDWKPAGDNRRAQVPGTDFVAPLTRGHVVGTIDWGTGPINVAINEISRYSWDVVDTNPEFSNEFEEKIKRNHMAEVTEATSRRAYYVTVDLIHADGTKVEARDIPPYWTKGEESRGAVPEPEMTWTDRSGDGIQVVDMPWLSEVIYGAPADGPRNMPTLGAQFDDRDNSYPAAAEADARRFGWQPAKPANNSR